MAMQPRFCIARIKTSTCLRQSGSHRQAHLYGEMVYERKKGERTGWSFRLTKFVVYTLVVATCRGDACIAPTRMLRPYCSPP
jgi:hypothetical protein